MKRNDLEFSQKDLEKIVGYLLYDLLELGFLNEKGTDLVFNKKETNSKIVKEITNTLSMAIREKKEEGEVL